MGVLENTVSVQDINYLLKWDKNDLNSIYSLCKNIREGDKKAVKEWDLLLENNGFVTPLKICKDEKYIMTLKGLARFCKLIVGASTKRPTHVAVGTGTATPTIIDSALTAETDSVEIALNGFLDATGTSIRYCGTFGTDVATNDFKESLLRDQSGAGGATVFCRNTFTTNFIDHDSGNAGFSAAGVFKLIPVA